jgi:hypothetical protein
MAFSSLSSTLYEVGKAIKKELFQTLKLNQDDLNSRLLTVEAAANKIRFFNGTVLNAATYASATGLFFHRVEASYDITDAKIAIFDKGSITTGTLSLDVQVASSPDFASSSSLFTTEPSLDLSVAASYSESNNAVLDNGVKSVTEGDYLRFDISSLPTGLSRFQIYLIGEPT